jgi:hypothetical protein
MNTISRQARSAYHLSVRLTYRMHFAYPLNVKFNNILEESVEK